MALITAADGGDLAGLLAGGVDANFEFQDLGTALIFAANAGHT